jgi:CheY-like chemotaxis protein
MGLFLEIISNQYSGFVSIGILFLLDSARTNCVLSAHVCAISLFRASMKKVLYLEDSLLDSALVETALRAKLPEVQLKIVSNIETFRSALETEKFFAVLCDNTTVNEGELTSVKVAKKAQPAVPVIVVSGHNDELRAAGAIKEGAFAYLNKSELWRLTFILSRLSAGRPLSANNLPPPPGIVTAFAETEFAGNDLGDEESPASCDY